MMTSFKATGFGKINKAKFAFLSLFHHSKIYKKYAKNSNKNCTDDSEDEQTEKDKSPSHKKNSQIE